MTLANQDVLYGVFTIDGDRIVSAVGHPRDEMVRLVGLDPLDLVIPKYQPTVWRALYQANATGERQTLVARRHGWLSCVAVVTKLVDGRLRLKVLCTVQASFPLGADSGPPESCVPAAMRSAR